MRSTFMDWALGILFSIGLVIAGSDGDWFPWVNLSGLLLILSASLLFNNQDRPRPRHG